MDRRNAYRATSRFRVAAAGLAAVIVSTVAISVAGTASSAEPVGFSADVIGGVQIYTCDTATGSYVFSRPQAGLAGPSGIIQHFRGPTWTARDGSQVTGTVVSSNANSAGDVPDLVLSATNDSAEGTLFAGITQIQRTNSTGGTAPTESCDASSPEAKVPYDAVYVFS